MELYNMPCWAAANAGLLEKFLPPEGTTQVTIYSDNDPNFAGQRSAYILANSLSKKGLKVNVVIPKLVGDFADEIAG
jgi:putative DNA primase/helicase